MFPLTINTPTYPVAYTRDRLDPATDISSITAWADNRTLRFFATHLTAPFCLFGGIIWQKWPCPIWRVDRSTSAERGCRPKRASLIPARGSQTNITCSIQLYRVEQVFLCLGLGIPFVYWPVSSIPWTGGVRFKSGDRMGTMSVYAKKGYSSFTVTP